MVFEEWYTSVVQPFLAKFVEFVPRLILAVIVFVVGYLISAAIGRLVVGILNKLKFNRLFEKRNWQEALEKAELKIDPAGFIGAIFKWIFVIVFLLLAVDILELTEFAGLLKAILAYLPNVIVAALIFVVAVIIADIVEKVVRAALEGAKFAYAHIGGAIVKWGIWIFAILAILRQLLVVPELVGTLFNALVYGVVALFVISAGIAFGLGGKDVAAELLEGLKKKLKG